MLLLVKIFIDTGLPYLNNFLLLSFPVPSAISSSITTKEILDVINEERVNAYKSGSRRSVPVELEVLDGNKFFDFSTLSSTQKASGNKLEFSSLSTCIAYFKSIGLTIKRDTLSSLSGPPERVLPGGRYVKLGKIFHRFSCKYLEKSLPDNFEVVN
ncbi:hypothetical protein GCM10023339_78230 [Alloalcanivorax gelatiniphagus]